MKIPKDIRSAIINLEKHQQKSTELNETIREWLKTVEDPEGEDGNILNCFIDILEMGRGNAKDLLEYIKRQ